MTIKIKSRKNGKEYRVSAEMWADMQRTGRAKGFEEVKSGKAKAHESKIIADFVALADENTDLETDGIQGADPA